MNRKNKTGQKGKFSLRERLKSFGPAFRGITTLLRYEHNARVHLVIFLIVIAAGFLMDISTTGWLAIFIVSGLVFAAECFNSAIEYLSDVVTGEDNEEIRRTKDVAAAGVLISVIIAVVAGIIIFVPGIVKLFH